MCRKSQDHRFKWNNRIIYNDEIDHIAIWNYALYVVPINLSIYNNSIWIVSDYYYYYCYFVRNKKLINWCEMMNVD